MIFNSLNFFIFLLITYFSYRCLKHGAQNILLLIASYVFYAWWDIRFLFLIVISTVVNYCCGILIAEPYINKKDRMTASLWLVSSCFLFITVQWQKGQVSFGSFYSLRNWQMLFSWDVGWVILGIVVLFVILLNLLHFRLEFREKTRRTIFLTIAIVANLGILGFFKYYNFFIDNIEWIIREFHLNPSTFHLKILLPIGISFYTFKGISYCVDTYKGKIPPARSYVTFAGFIAFFPALLAGPIDRASNLLRQFSEKRNITIDQTFRGLHLLLYGLFKKVVIADGVIRTITSVYETTGYVSWIDVVIATFLFTLQIYCDFSGYTDMARGIAKLFGFNLMINFKLPYFSQNPREFWSRWHISLSTWLRDYLYIPLGGNRHGTKKTYRNLMITMVLGGLWHGAAWNFILWGFYHGILLSIHRCFQSVNKTVLSSQYFWVAFTKGAFFFCLTCYGWLLFRAPSLDKIVSLTSTLIFDFGNMNFGASKPRLAVLCGLPIFFIIEAVEGFGGGKAFYKKIPVPVWTALYAAMIFCIGIGLTTEPAQFIYMVF